MKFSFPRVWLLVLTPFLLFCFLSFTQCSRKPHYQADISDVEIDPIQISRYEEVLFNINPFRLREEIDPYIEEFYFFLGEEIETPLGQQQLYDYITDPMLVELYLDAKEVWPDLSLLESSLTQAFRYYHYHFPEAEIPRIYTYISGLDYKMPIKYAGNHLIIGLDMYLGSDYENYGRVGIPRYQTRRMTPDFVVADVMKMMAEEYLQQAEEGPETLLDFMIYEGRVLYFLDCMLPEYPDTLKMAYTDLQNRWMQNNQGMVWSYFLDNDLIYDTDRQMINKFIGDAPFTAPFSRNSPPKTAAWLGWQIVREYMRRNNDVTLEELMAETDSRKVLNQSRFRPR